jgi:hypothetical protein
MFAVWERLMTPIRCMMITALALLACSSRRAEAHGLGVECKLKGAVIEIAAFFDDNTPAANAEVKVEDDQNRIIAEGRLDGEGHWSFARPAAARYRIRVNDGAGHLVRTTMNVPATSAEPLSGSTVSEGPSREEFTRFPWLKLTIGLITLGVLSAAFRIARRQSGSAPQSQGGNTQP